MTSRTALPPSLTMAVAAARIADLRREAEREHLARTVRSRRRSGRAPAWPAVVVAALRESLVGAAAGRTPEASPDRSGSACCA